MWLQRPLWLFTPLAVALGCAQAAWQAVARLAAGPAGPPFLTRIDPNANIFEPGPNS